MSSGTSTANTISIESGYAPGFPPPKPDRTALLRTIHIIIMAIKQAAGARFYNAVRFHAGLMLAEHRMRQKSRIKSWRKKQHSEGGKN